jgi:hypothetical protein
MQQPSFAGLLHLGRFLPKLGGGFGCRLFLPGRAGGPIVELVFIARLFEPTPSIAFVSLNTRQT